MALTAKQRKFWDKEISLNEDLAKAKVKQARNLLDRYDLRYKEKIRDITEEEAIKVPVFYQVVQQTIASIAFNYPKLFFTIEDDEGQGAPVSDILERAASSWLRLANARPHVHQAIFDALFMGTGWLRMDYNPPGDDMIAPYIANDSMAEDLVAVNRVDPAMVYVDPQCPPHILGHARYIIETMWVPLKQLKDDPDIEHKREIKATQVDENDELGFGDSMQARGDTAQQEALRQSVLNGENVKVRRIHDRMNKRQIMFAEGVKEEIQDIPHPFANMDFPQVMNPFTDPPEPQFDEEGQPVFNLEEGEEGSGFLVEQGFPFVPVKFDHSYDSYNPTSRMEYLKDLQDIVIESVSRQSAVLKRTARQLLVNKGEQSKNPNLADDIRRGDDGELHYVVDINNFKELQYGSVPAEQYGLEDRANMYIQKISAISEIGGQGDSSEKTATEAGLVAAASSMLREWMEARVGFAYEQIVRNAFQIMGDPRYEPEFFKVNVAGNQEQQLSRALRNADFHWNFRVAVQAGSTRPLFEQLEMGKALEFFDRAYGLPEFNNEALAKFLTSTYEIADPEAVLNPDVNEEAQQAIFLENNMILTTGQDPGVVPGQDHDAHLQGHPQYQEDPTYVAQFQAAQQGSLDSQQWVQGIDQLFQQHMAAHEAEKQAAISGATSPNEVSAPILGLNSRVNQNAQLLSQEVQNDVADIGGQ